MTLRQQNQIRFNRALGINREDALSQATQDGRLHSKVLRDSYGRRVRGKYSKPTFIGGLIG